MVTIGTPKSATATKVVLCGSGELGKEFVIELQRYGVEVIALDKYPDAPAMQVAHRSYVVSMLDGDALREIIEKEKPDYIVPEVEAIATRTLMELEEEGYHVIPTARAVLGLPIPNIVFHGAGASRAVVVEGDSDRLSLGNLDKVLEQPDTQMRFFGKPEVHGHRRMAVLLARGLDVTEAREKTGVMMERLNVKL